MKYVSWYLVLTGNRSHFKIDTRCKHQQLENKGIVFSICRVSIVWYNTGDTIILSRTTKRKPSCFTLKIMISCVISDNRYTADAKNNTFILILKHFTNLATFYTDFSEK